MSSLPPSSSLRLAEFAVAVSLATDLGQGKPLEMVLGTCILSMRLGELLGIDDDELRTLYYLSLLRHAGCTADSAIAAEVFGDDLAISPAFFQFVDPTKPWTLLKLIIEHAYAERSTVSRLISVPRIVAAFTTAILARCEVASLFASRLGLDEHLQRCLRQCNEAWNGRGIPGKRKGEEIERAVRVVQVAEEVVALTQFLNEDAAVTAVRARAGKTLDPVAAQTFLANHRQLSIDTHIGSPSLRERVLSLEPGASVRLANAELDAVAGALADFADLKAPHMLGHSQMVSRLAYRAGKVYGLSGSEAETLRRAALVHDLGRVAVSSAIWCKSGPLSEGEWERVRLHPYYTQRILAQPRLLESWGTIASTHHESLDGSGYHRGLDGTMLDDKMRILAVADRYQGWTEGRPYRDALPPEEAAAEIRREVRAGRLDSKAADSVLNAAGHHTTPVRRERLAGLTERELEVLSWVARGHTNREIAARLFLSQKTVGNHLQSIYGKIDVTTRAAATYFAMQHHLI